MKKPRNNRNLKIVIIVIICLTFIVGIGAGIGAGTYISNKKAQKMEVTKLKDTALNDSSQVKGDGAEKEDDKKPEADKPETNDSKDDKDSGSGDNSQNSSQNKDNADNSSQSQNQGSTYDASVPADDTGIHRYEYIISDCTWQEAFQDCLNRGGYLVRINSSKEYETIRKEISRQKMTDIYFKLGGRRDNQSQDYYWVNQDNKLFGEKLNSDDSWCSDEWMGGEPSFQDGNLEEKYMDLFFYDGEKRFVWNDVPDDMLAAEPAYSGKLGYICEYED
ncbi:hypothetical protein GCM10008910_40420 [Faecalicatena orotica]|uniref:Lectin-like protein n=1 Tax=Faecalicatena orotica TaxID=1544 RepID=A0A2Y9CAN7_9FIRM|nr:C-type lectin domain-containing protein [Faecalicatena orotica]PWJ22968.1 lectin-like protein [Faecalicatena orotica]SSA58104.1 Lectin C-type domain-containing protein [Faecalicatena orotica]